MCVETSLALCEPCSPGAAVPGPFPASSHADPALEPPGTCLAASIPGSPWGPDYSLLPAPLSSSSQMAGPHQLEPGEGGPCSGFLDIRDPKQGEAASVPCPTFVKLPEPMVEAERGRSHTGQHGAGWEPAARPPWDQQGLLPGPSGISPNMWEQTDRHLLARSTETPLERYRRLCSRRADRERRPDSRQTDL